MVVYREVDRLAQAIHKPAQNRMRDLRHIKAGKLDIGQVKYSQSKPILAGFGILFDIPTSLEGTKKPKSCALVEIKVPGNIGYSRFGPVMRKKFKYSNGTIDGLDET